MKIRGILRKVCQYIRVYLHHLNIHLMATRTRVNGKMNKMCQMKDGHLLNRSSTVNYKLRIQFLFIPRSTRSVQEITNGFNQTSIPQVGFQLHNNKIPKIPCHLVNMLARIYLCGLLAMVRRLLFKMYPYTILIIHRISQKSLKV